MALPVPSTGEGLRGGTDLEPQTGGAGETTERSGLSIAAQKEEPEEEEEEYELEDYPIPEDPK